MKLLDLFWGKRDARETRASQPFTDAVVAAYQAAATGDATRGADATAALEAAAGLIGRAMSMATIEPANGLTAAITPAVLAQIGRQLIRRGESLWRISASGEAVKLEEAGSWDVRGDSDANLWSYRLDVFGPSGNDTFHEPAESVLHFRYATDPARPWLGIAPMAWAASSARLHGQLENALADDAATQRAYIIPVPIPGDSPELAALRTALPNLRGKATFAETTADGWQAGAGIPRQDWQASRIGANPPQPLVQLQSQTAMSVLAACGVPIELVTPQGAAAEREAYRRFLFSTLAPLGALVAQELSAKLETVVRLDWREIMAADITGRARAYAQLKGAGMDERRARRLAGLE